MKFTEREGESTQPCWGGGGVFRSEIQKTVDFSSASMHDPPPLLEIFSLLRTNRDTFISFFILVPNSLPF